jgi:hypothetical protein
MLAAGLLVAGAHVRAQEPAASDIEQLREAIELLRQDYEQRIAELERRLEAAEARSDKVAAVPTPAPPAPVAEPAASRAAGGDSAFNPAIGVIFQGRLPARPAPSRKDSRWAKRRSTSAARWTTGSPPG